MKNITFVNNKLGFVLSFGLILLLLLGSSYSTSIESSSSSTEETEKIPLYYTSTRDPQNPTYEIVTGPGYGNDIYQNVNELTS